MTHQNLADQIEIVRKNLRHPDDLERQAAAFAAMECAEQLDDADFVTLWALTRYDIYQTVRIAAAQTLCLLKKEDANKTAHHTILSLLSYPGLGQPHHQGMEEVRALAAAALVKIQYVTPDVMRALIYAMQDDYAVVRNAAKTAFVALWQQQEGIAHEAKEVDTMISLSIVELGVIKDVVSGPPPSEKTVSHPPQFFLTAQNLRRKTHDIEVRGARGSSHPSYQANLSASIKISTNDFFTRFESKICEDKTALTASREEARKFVIKCTEKQFIKRFRDRIIWHARRRVDLFFYTLVFLWKKTQDNNKELFPAHPPCTHGKGFGGKTPLDTQACHDALFSAFRLVYFDPKVEREIEENPLDGKHFQNSLNMTTELPIAVNQFDTGYLEGRYDEIDKLRYKLFPVLKRVASGRRTSLEGMCYFFQIMSAHFEALEKAHLSEADQDPIFKLIFYAQKQGTFGIFDDPADCLWSTEDGRQGISMSYVYLLLRADAAERESFAKMPVAEVVVSELFEKLIEQRQKEFEGKAVITLEDTAFVSKSKTCERTAVATLGLFGKSTPAAERTFVDRHEISNEELIEKAMAVIDENELMYTEAEMGSDKKKREKPDSTPWSDDKREKLAQLALELAQSPFHKACYALYLGKSRQDLRNLMQKNITELRVAYRASHSTADLSPSPFREGVAAAATAAESPLRQFPVRY